MISQLRREAVRKTLFAFLKTPGLSNRELFLELNMGDSAVNRYVKELMERGIVENAHDERRTSYAIKNEYREMIAVPMKPVLGPLSNYTKGKII